MNLLMAPWFALVTTDTYATIEGAEDYLYSELSATNDNRTKSTMHAEFAYLTGQR